MSMRSRRRESKLHSPNTEFLRVIAGAEGKEDAGWEMGLQKHKSQSDISFEYNP